MKTKNDFIIPFAFKDRKPIFIDGLFLIPSNFDHKLNGFIIDFEKKDIFKEKRQINIEFCSGNGEWIIEKAKENPEINWIAVEMKFERARQIWVKKHNNNLNNLFIIFGKAEDFINFYTKKEFATEIFINFPDPWPKKKHEKNRIFSKKFFNDVSLLLKKCGKLFLVTDDEDTSYRMIDAALESCAFTSIFEKPYYVTDMKNYGRSYFEDLWRSKNKEIRYMQFKLK